MTDMLSITGLSKVYNDGLVALDDISDKQLKIYNNVLKLKSVPQFKCLNKYLL